LALQVKFGPCEPYLYINGMGHSAQCALLSKHLELGSKSSGF
jgi:hypothetical protein